MPKKLVTLEKCFLTFVMFDITGKNGPKIFSPEHSYFVKCLFLSTSKVPKKRWHLLHNICQNTLWTLVRCCSPIISCSKIGEKIGHNVFFIRMFPFYLKNFIFHQPLRSWRIDLITSTVFVGKPVGPLQFVPWGFLHSMFREEKTPKYLYSLESLPFLSKVCDFNNLLGLKKMLWQALQY